MKHIIFILTLTLITGTSYAQKLRVQKVSTLGPLKHKVIFQSTNLKRVKGTNTLKGKLVTMWGVHVYEVVTGLYACDKRNSCKLVDYERNASFKKCEVKSQNKVTCSGPIQSETIYSENHDEVVSRGNPDEIYDEYGSSREYFDYYNEYPSEGNSEFDDIFYH